MYYIEVLHPSYFFRFFFSFFKFFPTLFITFWSFSPFLIFLVFLSFESFNSKAYLNFLKENIYDYRRNMSPSSAAPVLSFFNDSRAVNISRQNS